MEYRGGGKFPVTLVQRTAFCNQLVNTVEKKPQFLDQFIVSDEAVFSLNLEVNTRNVIRYSEVDILPFIPFSLLKVPIK